VIPDRDFMENEARPLTYQTRTQYILETAFGYARLAWRGHAVDIMREVMES
jgi:hypothetical protein